MTSDPQSLIRSNALRRGKMAALLRGSPPVRMLKQHKMGVTVKRVMHVVSSPQEFVKGYRYGKRLGTPVSAGAPSISESEPNPLEVYFDSLGDGPGIWKWRHYFDIYHRHLAPLRGRPLNVLEIGIYSGGSLGMWSDYFGPACRIYGVDINDACREYENEQVTVFIGDQADPAFWTRFLAEVPDLDVVIDDGGHRSYQQIATLEALLPHIRFGGVYVCEDISGPFQPFLSFVDGLTRPFSNAPRGTPAAIHQQVASVHRYPLVTVIEKPKGPTPDFVCERHGTEWQPFLSRMHPGLNHA